MKKTFLSLVSVLLALVLLAGVFVPQAFAYTEAESVAQDAEAPYVNGFPYSYDNVVSSGDFSYYKKPDGSALIVDYNGNGETLNIPEQADGLTVSEINFRSFKNSKKFEKIIIPKTVSKIGTLRASTGYEDIYCKSYECADENKTFCTVDGVLYTKDMTVLVSYPNLSEKSSFALPTKVKTIFDFAFSNSAALKEVTLSSGVGIGSGAFFMCKNLTNVKSFPLLPWKYATGCFCGCEKITGFLGFLIGMEKDGLPEGWEGFNSEAEDSGASLKPFATLINRIAAALSSARGTQSLISIILELF
ncbi:MAG: leucine-rich repeat protein [Clostridia bacterium]|nr:leucine-rich repeat protein [Clostridia bacterium]